LDKSIAVSVALDPSGGVIIPLIIKKCKPKIKEDEEVRRKEEQNPGIGDAGILA
jgi:hypothetical protein